MIFLERIKNWRLNTFMKMKSLGVGQAQLMNELDFTSVLAVSVIFTFSFFDIIQVHPCRRP